MKPNSRVEKGLGIKFAESLQVKPSAGVAPSSLVSPAAEAPRTAIVAMRMEAQGSQIALLNKQLQDVQAGVKLHPKMIRHSKWANRLEPSFHGAAYEALKSEISGAGGNVQPIKVRPIAGSVPQEFEIVFGHRRHRCCLELGLSVLVIIESVDDRTLFVEMDRENRGRADLRPYEQGLMYKRALDSGLFGSIRKLAESLGVDVSIVSKAKAIADLPDAILSAFASPLDVQFRWAKVLGDRVQADPDLVLAAAAEISQLKGTPLQLSSLAAFEKLAGQGAVPSSFPYKISTSKSRVVVEMRSLSEDQQRKLEKFLHSLLGSNL